MLIQYLRVKLFLLDFFLFFFIITLILFNLSNTITAYPAPEKHTALPPVMAYAAFAVADDDAVDARLISNSSFNITNLLLGHFLCIQTVNKANSKNYPICLDNYALLKQLSKTK